MLLPAQEIRRRALVTGMIKPFCERTEFNGVTHGLGPAGYDFRIGEDVRLWPGHSVCVDALEELEMPDDLAGLLYTKSTWARLHVTQAGTVVDPGFCGKLRLEISQHGGEPITIPACTGFVHMVFVLLVAATTMPYRGRYQNQGPNQGAILK